MAFGKKKPEVPITPGVTPDGYEADRLRAEMIGGRQLPCGCVLAGTSPFSREVLRNCWRHTAKEKKS